VGRLIGDDVRLVIDAPDNLPNVCADPAQLEQIVVNLAINARDAMPRGGDLFVRVRPHVLGRPRPGREVQPPGEYVQIVVEDTGEGIRPELLPRVFEPFFTTKGLQGTGLGLSTVYGIVKQSGGFIWIESEVGKGTTFTIDFPVATDDAPVAAIAETTPPPQGVPGGRILVVEDQENVRVLTRELLESAGYEVIASATPHEALQLATSGDRPIDLVLTDVTMPGMTGAELAAAIRAERPGLPVLFMSGLPKALESDGPGPILAKPFTRASLIAHVSGPGATSA
jgi:two-component system, cell cycle sensor histidine kinase and response regulator CckA